MTEYIDREAAIKAIKGLESATSFDFNEGLISAMNVVDEIQSEDVQHVVHGKWVQTGGKYSRHKTIDRRILTCSVCGNALSMEGVNAGRGDANYCPNCGAKMDGET